VSGEPNASTAAPPLRLQISEVTLGISKMISRRGRHLSQQIRLMIVVMVVHSVASRLESISILLYMFRMLLQEPSVRSLCLDLGS
jgi:hypothetical protein